MRKQSTKGRGSGDCLEIFSIMMGRKGENLMELFHCQMTDVHLMLGPDILSLED